MLMLIDWVLEHSIHLIDLEKTRGLNLSIEEDPYLKAYRLHLTDGYYHIVHTIDPAALVDSKTEAEYRIAALLLDMELKIRESHKFHLL